jgi:hypothetical protein
MHYRAVILDGLSSVPPKALSALKQLAAGGRLIVWGDPPSAATLKGTRRTKSPDELVSEIDRHIKPDLTLQPPSTNIRFRHVVKSGDHFYMLFNEEPEKVETRIDVAVKGKREWLNPFTAEAFQATADGSVVFQPHEMKLLRVSKASAASPPRKSLAAVLPVSLH